MPFTYPTACGDDSGFLRLCDQWDAWLRTRMQLCGGWSDEMEKACRARALGAFEFSIEQSQVLEEIGLRLGSLYRRIGKALAEIAHCTSEVQRESTLNSFMEGYSHAQTQVLHQALSSPFARDERCWATTLRADFLWTSEGPKIVEVNSDNVGGVEDLLLHLSFYARPDNGSRTSNGRSVAASLSLIRDNLLHWLKEHWARFRAKTPDAPEYPTIAFVSEDWDCSLFLSKYQQAAIGPLLPGGWRTTSCRPELISDLENQLCVEDIWGERSPVHIVMRNWLFHEMFDKSGDLKSPFAPILNAASTGRVLVLNPFFDRWLFSKDWLRRLHCEQGLPIELTDKEREFVQRFVVPTRRATVEDLCTGAAVIKPIQEFGGKGVFYRSADGSTSGKLPSEKDVIDGGWLFQPKIDMDKPKAWLRTQVLKSQSYVASEHAMNVILGMIVHCGDKARLSGVQIRMGTDPVVNWSRGAQVLPGILSEHIAGRLD